MRKYVFGQKVKSLLSFLCILILLPYVITVFMNGSRIAASGNVQAAYVYCEDGGRMHQVLWEEYFVGALAKEIPAENEMEALKAQAVILRTSLYQELENTPGNELTAAYLSRQELEKKWGIHFAENYEKLEKAMDETAGEVLLFNETYARLPYHRSSSGMTRNASEVWKSADYPYLTAKECPQDKEAPGEIHSVRVSYWEIQEKFQAVFLAMDEETAKQPLVFSDFAIEAADQAGYVTDISIRGTHISGEQFREILSLSSSAFSLQDGGDEGLVITVNGNGHGLGLSQWTANEMAKSGKTYEEILLYFFDGTSLADDGEIFVKLE